MEGELRSFLPPFSPTGETLEAALQTALSFVTEGGVRKPWLCRQSVCAWYERERACVCRHAQKGFLSDVIPLIPDIELDTFAVF